MNTMVIAPVTVQITATVSVAHSNVFFVNSVIQCRAIGLLQ
jgi:hypothetical protein